MAPAAGSQRDGGLAAGHRTADEGQHSWLPRRRARERAPPMRPLAPLMAIFTSGVSWFVGGPLAWPEHRRVARYARRRGWRSAR